MSANAIIIQGVIKPDGTLELEGKVPLPAGKVQVTLQPVPDLPEGDPFFDMLKGIWAGQKARGHVPRSAEDVEAARAQMRDEWEERMQRIHETQAESGKPREGA